MRRALWALTVALVMGAGTWWTQAHLQIWLREFSAATGIALHLRWHPDLRLDIAVGYVAAATIYGTEFVRRHLPRLMLFMPIGDWVLYGVIQVAFGAVVGTVALPYLIGKQFHTANHTEQIARHVRCALLPSAPSLSLHR